MKVCENIVLTLMSAWTKRFLPESYHPCLGPPFLRLDLCPIVINLSHLLSSYRSGALPPGAAYRCLGLRIKTFLQTLKYVTNSSCISEQSRPQRPC